MWQARVWVGSYPIARRLRMPSVTRFVIGMLAGGLWIAATIVVIALARNAPARPSKSIRTFRLARRKLAPVGLGSRRRLGGVTGLVPEGPSEFAAPPRPWRSDHRLDTVEVFPIISETEVSEGREGPAGDLTDVPISRTLDPELAEVAALVESISDESRAVRRPSHRIIHRPQSKPPHKSGTRKVGRLTYVLVDEEGRPELD